MSARGTEAGLTASRDAPLGGQAVLEGVMMRGISTWAVAVRKPGADAVTDGAEPGANGAESGANGAAAPGPIDVQSFPLVAWTKRRRIYRWPVIRGVVALVESLAIGLRALGISANAQLPEGRFIKDYPGYIFYVGRNDRTNLQDVMVFVLKDENGGTTIVKAPRGKISVDAPNKRQARVVVPTYDHLDRNGPARRPIRHDDLQPFPGQRGHLLDAYHAATPHAPVD